MQRYFYASFPLARSSEARQESFCPLDKNLSWKPDYGTSSPGVPNRLQAKSGRELKLRHTRHESPQKSSTIVPLGRASFLRNLFSTIRDGGLNT